MKPISLNFIVLLSSLSLFLSHEMHGQKGTVRIHKNSQIDTLIKLKKEVNLSELNYKIQIFSGVRSGAEKAQKELINLFLNGILRNNLKHLIIKYGLEILKHALKLTEHW